VSTSLQSLSFLQAITPASPEPASTGAPALPAAPPTSPLVTDPLHPKRSAENRAEVEGLIGTSQAKGSAPP
jgi:hypothetical protein